MNDANECQILITVLDILQIMLMSPSNARSWTPRVKQIIFDEVHSIGNAEDGLVWEQLLLLSPCPIIALSATVGNPEEFGSWLASTQRSIDSEERNGLIRGDALESFKVQPVGYGRSHAGYSSCCGTC
ncbi:hypothetical protein B9Z19DRAFT_660542 [Tuber borchii]|uniref:Helicase ATP-binding domain-containing protein n=1 Tax=Tuber borchii TaxID=42251 RepID=A0A2T6ZAL6_TUBBO|nr:hypothetical protein B9Z19DRAFT_660542 [Tuber borchii]